MDNLTFGLAMNLPPPDQTESPTGSSTATSIPLNGTPTSSMTRATGETISGVDASKGAMTATGANSLIVDQGVESLMSAGVSSNTSLENAENAFFTTPPDFGIDPQTQIETLDKEINNLNEIGPTFGLFSLAVTSALKEAISSSSVAEKVKGSESARTEKGDRRDEGRRAEGKATAEAASPSADDSVSRAVSPTGTVTTTISSESVNSSGSVTTDTSTSVSGGGSSSQQSTSDTSSEPTTEGTISMTQIMDEIGGLESQESQTMAQQQISEIAAIQLQASDTIAGADKLMQGAAMMMTMATVGLATSMATSAYQMGGIGSASKEGDEAEMSSLNEHQESLENTSESTMESMEASSKNAGSAEAHVNAQKSAIQLRSLARDKKTPENIKGQANDLADNVDKASRNAAYTTGGTKNTKGDLSDEDYQKTPDGQQASADATAAARKENPTQDPPPTVTITTPDQAVEFYQKQAAASHNALKQSISSYKTALSGKTISDDAAKSAIYESWPKDKQESYDAADEAGKSAMIDGPANEYKTNIANVKINRNSSAWNQAYQNRSQQIQIYAGTGQALSQVFNSAGNMEDTIGQAEQQEDSAAAQVQGSTEQAMAQGVQQTQSLAEQFRQSQTAVAQDMQSMVGSTKV